MVKTVKPMHVLHVLCVVTSDSKHLSSVVRVSTEIYPHFLV